MLWMLLGLTLAVAVGAGLAWYLERTRRHALEEERSALAAELEETRREAERRRRAFEERDRERGELRRKLDKIRKRTHAAVEERPGFEARIAELEEALGQRAEQVRAARDEAIQLASQLAREGERRAQAAAQVSAQAESTAHREQAEVARIGQRAEAAEAEARDLGRRLAEAEREASRYRARERTHRRVYLVIKGELDAARDRLRTLEQVLTRSGAVVPAPDAPPAPEAAAEDASEPGPD